MTAALFGLIGVLVGALLAVTLQYLLGVRNEYGAATAAARLIIAELNVLIEIFQSGNVDASRALEAPAWDQQKAALALVLPDEHWKVVAHVYAKLAAIGDRGHPQPGRHEPQEQFSQAAERARTLLCADTAAGCPLHRRGSLLERRLAHWPDADDVLKSDGGRPLSMPGSTEIS